MGLPPLEYIDCYLDSPSFRDTIALYEKELEENAVHVKSLVKECRHMIQATEEFSKAQHSFATALSNFKFESIGGETEAEKMIMNSLQTFAQLLLTIEDYRHSMLSTISVRLLQNLERFRKEHIQSTKEEKKQFDRSSEKYYQSLEKKLGMSNKKKESALNEHDQHLEIEHAGFRQASFNYVCKLQQVHAMKQYELIEPIIGYISDVSTFLHQAYDNICALKPELRAVQFKVQILRETQLEEQQKQYELKAQVIEWIRHPCKPNLSRTRIVKDVSIYTREYVITGLDPDACNRYSVSSTRKRTAHEERQDK
ncbi:Rho GTPase-activating protein 42 [Geodia barretti]|uniref:Rho GTPase-activating protein 42 n=1 Tax=Geodia barretti TaxID=519541 RepID=A0AA35SBQ2_GEOBA|nr:Rho GTPase-activating protein 42 [Geodia barretti]